MTDIVERLNEPCPCSYCDGDAANQRDEAKAEIERLRELNGMAAATINLAKGEIDRLRESLIKIAEWDLTGTAIAALEENK